MLDMLTPYLDMYRTTPIRRYKKPTKIHRETCPSCDRKRVTLYFSAQCEMYLCKQCTPKAIRRAKSEAIKEFSERLKEQKLFIVGGSMVFVSDIDSLAKEMVGEGE